MYLISRDVLVIQDSPERIDFHIKSGDYFAFLATLMGFLEESLANCTCANDVQQEYALANQLRQDLRYVQANYKIVEREQGEIQQIQPKFIAL